MHFGIAREHSHAAPPNNCITPADSEKVFVVKDMANSTMGQMRRP